MNFFNRAIKNVTRKLSKSILLAITFFVIGNFVIVGLGVSQAAESAKTLTRQKMRAVVTYSLDYDALWEYENSIEDEDELQEFYKNYPRITVDDVKEIIKDKRVKTANSINSNFLYKIDNSSVDFVKLGNEYEKNMEMNEGKNCYFDYETGNEICYQYHEPTFFVKTNLFPSMIEIEDGDYTIVEGRFYSQEEIDNAENVVLVSKAFAELNGLHLEDEFTIWVSDPGNTSSSDGEDTGITEEDYEAKFKIIGIFDTKTHITPDNSNYDYLSPYENSDNMLLMPATSLYAASLNASQKEFDYYKNKWPDDEYYQDPDNRPSMENMMKNTYVSDVTLLLNDPLEVDNFVEEYSNNLPQFMMFDANNEEFNKLAKPLDTLNLYSNFIVWLVVINAIVIITLVTALTLKTREYEIGVLLSIGASKIKVVAQFFIELALVAILGFTLSVGSGSLIANKVGALMLEYQIQEQDFEEGKDYYFNDDYYNIWDTDYTTEVTLDDLIAEYNVSISPVIIAEIYVLGLGIVFISVIIPSIMIMRFNPKKILMNQN